MQIPFNSLQPTLVLVYSTSSIGELVFNSYTEATDEVSNILVLKPVLQS